MTTFTSVQAPVWADSSKTVIDCKVTINGLGDELLPFTASPSDTEEHGRLLFKALVHGEFGTIADYVGPTMAELAIYARHIRNALLASSDWTQAGDVPQVTKDLWIPYRQALREVPDQVGFPEDILWPTVP